MFKAKCGRGITALVPKGKQIFNATVSYHGEEKFSYVSKLNYGTPKSKVVDSYISGNGYLFKDKGVPYYMGRENLKNYKNIKKGVWISNYLFLLERSKMLAAFFYN